MIKKALKWFTDSNEQKEFNEQIHIVCNECAGSGIDFIAGPCLDCDGDGFVDKTRSEIWKEKLSQP